MVLVGTVRHAAVRPCWGFDRLSQRWWGQRVGFPGPRFPSLGSGFCPCAPVSVRVPRILSVGSVFPFPELVEGPPVFVPGASTGSASGGGVSALSFLGPGFCPCVPVSVRVSRFLSVGSVFPFPELVEGPPVFVPGASTGSASGGGVSALGFRGHGFRSLSACFRSLSPCFCSLSLSKGLSRSGLAPVVGPASGGRPFC